MTITQQNDGGKITVKIDGWLDTANSPALGAVIEQITQATELILDFAAVEYMSSAGVRQVVASHRAAKALGASFAVIHVNPDVMSIFSMTGLHTKIDIRTDAQ